MVKTKRNPKKKPVLRKTAKNKSNNLQIFKQKLQKIRRDLAKLNKKYDVKTRKQHYKSKVLKGGGDKEAVDAWAKIQRDIIETTPTVMPGVMNDTSGEIRDTFKEFKESYDKSSNPKFLSNLMELFKKFIELIAQLFKRKSTKPEEAEAEEEAEEAHGKADRAKNPKVREALLRREKLAAAATKTKENAALAEDNLGLAEQLTQTFGF